MDAYETDSDARHGPGGAPEPAAGPDRAADPRPAVPAAPGPDADVPGPDADVPGPDAAASGPDAEVPEPAHSASEPRAQVPEPALPVSEPRAQVPEPALPVSEPRAQVPEPALPVSEPRAEVPEPGLQAPEPGSSPGVLTGPYVEPRTGVAALSLRYRIGAAMALAVVAVTVFVHIGMVFLHVAPPNTITKQHGKAIDDWIYPEFEQNWKLFAPNPLQQNIAVQVRAEVRTADGGVRTTGWYDLSAEDGRAIDGNLLPSHTEQNELRRAWDFFLATHDGANHPADLRGSLSEAYLRRIAVMRLDRDGAAGKGAVIGQVQVRSSTTNVPPPKWSGERISVQPIYRVLPWWPVTAADTDGGAE